MSEHSDVVLHPRTRLRASRACGSHTQVRRTALAESSPDWPAWRTADAHREAILDSRDLRRSAAVVCLGTAALLHGGRLLHNAGNVHVATSYKAGGMPRSAQQGGARYPPSRALGPKERRIALGRRTLVRHSLPLTASDIVEVDGLRVTSIERTLVDCARFLEPDDGLVAVDSLLASLTGAAVLARPWDDAAAIDSRAAQARARLQGRLATLGAGRGTLRARAVLACATPWSQSPWETEMRRRCLVAGMVTPRPQMAAAVGERTFFLDLGWWGLRLGVEVDGDVKYAHDGDLVEVAQRDRDDALMGAGFGVVHVTPREIADGSAMERLRSELPRTLFEDRPRRDLRTRAERPRRPR